MEIPCGDTNKCTGCKACVVTCPFDAIMMKENKYGVSIPYIIEDKCKHCDKCENHCPVNNCVKVQPIKECYAAIAVDPHIYETTSSGGVGTVLAKQILKKNGVVYGAAYVENTVKHIRVDNVNGLDYIKGSKYVQSEAGDVYPYVRKDLLDQKAVLFIGTPCQVAGLKSYLRREYNNLLTVDLICHGAPPMQYLKEYLKEIVPYDDISKVTFRSKEWKLNVYSEKKLLYSKINVEDYYFTAFTQGIIFRENCYKCLYAQNKRCSDITIGDFWGIGKTNLPDKAKSVVLIISDKGKRLWRECKDQFLYEKRNSDEAIAGNSQLRAPSVSNKKRERFLKAYSKNGFKAGIIACGIKFRVDFMRMKHRLVSLKNN